MDYTNFLDFFDENDINKSKCKLNISISRGDDYKVPPEPIQQLFNPKLPFFSRFQQQIQPQQFNILNLQAQDFLNL